MKDDNKDTKNIANTLKDLLSKNQRDQSERDDLKNKGRYKYSRLQFRKDLSSDLSSTQPFNKRDPQPLGSGNKGKDKKGNLTERDRSLLNIKYKPNQEQQLNTSRSDGSDIVERDRESLFYNAKEVANFLQEKEGVITEYKGLSKTEREIAGIIIKKNDEWTANFRRYAIYKTRASKEPTARKEGRKIIPYDDNLDAGLGVIIRGMGGVAFELRYNTFSGNRRTVNQERERTNYTIGELKEKLQIKDGRERGLVGAPIDICTYNATTKYLTIGDPEDYSGPCVKDDLSGVKLLELNKETTRDGNDIGILHILQFIRINLNDNGQPKLLFCFVQRNGNPSGEVQKKIYYAFNDKGNEIPYVAKDGISYTDGNTESVGEEVKNNLTNQTRILLQNLRKALIVSERSQGREYEYIVDNVKTQELDKKKKELAELNRELVEKKEELCDIIASLEDVDKKRDEAELKKTSILEEIVRLNLELDLLRLLLINQKGTAEELKNKNTDAFEQQKKVQELNEEISNLKSELESAEKKSPEQIENEKQLSKIRREEDDQILDDNVGLDPREQVEIERNVLREQLDSKQDQNNKLQERLEQIESQKSDLQKKLGQKKNELNDKELKLNQKQQEHQEAISKKEKEIESLNEKVTNEAGKIYGLEQKLEKQTEQIKKINLELELLKTEKEKLEEEKNGSVDKVKKNDKTIQENNKKIQQLTEVNDLLSQKKLGLEQKNRELGRKIKKAEDEKQKIETELQTRKNKVLELEQRIEGLNSETQKNQEAIQGKELEINQLKALLQGATQKAEQSVQGKDQNIENLNNQIVKLTSEVNDLKKKDEESTKELSRLQTQLSAANREKEELQQNLGDSEKSLEAKNNEIARANEEIADLKKSQEESENKIDELEQEIARRAQLIQELNEKSNNLTTKNNDLTKELEGKNTVKTKLEEQLNKLKTECDQYKAEVDKINQEKARIEQDQKKKEEELRQMKADIRKLGKDQILSDDAMRNHEDRKKSVEELKKEIDELEGKLGKSDEEIVRLKKKIAEAEKDKKILELGGKAKEENNKDPQLPKKQTQSKQMRYDFENQQRKKYDYTAESKKSNNQPGVVPDKNQNGSTNDDQADGRQNDSFTFGQQSGDSSPSSFGSINSRTSTNNQTDEDLGQTKNKQPLNKNIPVANGSSSVTTGNETVGDVEVSFDFEVITEFNLKNIKSPPTHVTPRSARRLFSLPSRTIGNFGKNF